MLCVRIARHYRFGVLLCDREKRTAQTRYPLLCVEELFTNIEMCINKHLIVSRARGVKLSAIFTSGTFDEVGLHIHVDIFLFRGEDKLPTAEI